VQNYSLCIPTTGITVDILRTLNEFIAGASTMSEVIIVIDGGHEDRMLDSYYFLGERLRVIFSPENRGPAYSRNLAAKLARNETLVFLDDDVFVPHTVLEALAEPRVGVVTVPSVKPQNPRTLSSRFFSDYALAPKYKFSALIPVSACFSISRTDYFAVDGFSESFKKAAGEDTDFFTRLSKVGVTVTHRSELRVFHRNPMNFIQLGKRAYRYGFHGHQNIRVSPVFGEKASSVERGIGIGMFLMLPVTFGVTLVGGLTATLSTGSDVFSRVAKIMKDWQGKISEDFETQNFGRFSRLRISLTGRRFLNRLLSLEFSSPWNGIVPLDDKTLRDSAGSYRFVLLYWRIILFSGFLIRLTKNRYSRRTV